MRILSGDVTASTITLGLFEAGEAGLRMIARERTQNRAPGHLEEAVVRFSNGGAGWDAAALAVHGGLRGGDVRPTELPWKIDAHSVASALGSGSVSLLSEVEASAWGISLLRQDDCLVLAEGRPDPRANQALIVAGSDLGETSLVWNGGRYEPFPSEGGHTAFAPRSDLGLAFSDHLRGLNVQASWHRVLSDSGLVNLFLFLYQHRGLEVPAWLLECEEVGRSAACIANAALFAPGLCHPCREALDLFIGFYGTEAGNLALEVGATGGLFIGGNLAPRIAKELASPAFLQPFCDRGPLQQLMERIPVTVILDEDIVLRGAARYAALLAE